MTTLLIATLLFASTLKPSYSKDEVRVEYDRVIEQTRPAYGVSYTIVFERDTLSSSWMASFFRENRPLVDYIYAHSSQLAYEYHKQTKLEGTVQDILNDSAKLSTVMFERLLPLISNYLNAKGSTIEGYEPLTKPAITLDKLVGNGAKFFYPDSIQPDGRMRSHTCIGINGFKESRDVRNVIMEAFCWTVVETTLYDENSPLQAEFEKALRVANDLQLSSDPGIKLKRYQGAIWMYMSQSKLLRDMLFAEYEKKKQLLTFTLKPS